MPGTKRSAAIVLAVPVVCLGILGTGLKRPLKNFSRVLPLLLLAISITKIVERHQVIRTQLERFLKIRNSLAGPPLSGREKAKVVPRVRHSIRIARMKFDGPFEALLSFTGLLLIQRFCE
jgi:hypothetical protein